MKSVGFMVEGLCLAKNDENLGFYSKEIKTKLNEIKEWEIEKILNMRIYKVLSIIEGVYGRTWYMGKERGSGKMWRRW